MSELCAESAVQQCGGNGENVLEVAVPGLGSLWRLPPRKESDSVAHSPLRITCCELFIWAGRMFWAERHWGLLTCQYEQPFRDGSSHVMLVSMTRLSA